MSTTTNRDVAIGYAGGLQGAQPMVFEMRQGMIDRGADISWFSQYPHEREILFGPLTCIELSGAQTEGNAIILDMNLTVNLLAPTIERVVARLKTSHVDLLELIKLRVSQINRCAYCIDMHSKDATALGETPQRIYALSAWKDAPFFSHQERLALAWAEALTLNQEIDDPQLEEMQAVWSDAEIVNLTLAINAINSWNRVARTFKPEVGSYQTQY